MELTKTQHREFAKGYQDQHDDVFGDIAEHFGNIQVVILDTDIKHITDFNDFGKEAFLYKLEQYCKQARLLREIQGLTNTSDNRCKHEAMEEITALNGDEYGICHICNYSKKL